MVKLKIFVGNFPRETTLKELYKFFEGIAINKIRICNPQQKSKGKRSNDKPYCILIVSTIQDYQEILRNGFYWLNDIVQLKVTPYERKGASNSFKQNQEQEYSQNANEQNTDNRFYTQSSEEHTQQRYGSGQTKQTSEDRNLRQYSRQQNDHQQVNQRMMDQRRSSDSSRSSGEKYGISSNPHKVFVYGVPMGWNSQDLKKRMISFGKVENVIIIDKMGLDKYGFEHLTSLDDEAIVQRNKMMLNSSMVRVAHVQYSASREVKRALDLGEIKYREEKIKFFSFLSQNKSQNGNGSITQGGQIKLKTNSSPFLNTQNNLNNGPLPLLGAFNPQYHPNQMNQSAPQQFSGYPPYYHQPHQAANPHQMPPQGSQKISPPPQNPYAPFQPSPPPSQMTVNHSYMSQPPNYYPQVPTQPVNRQTEPNLQDQDLRIQNLPNNAFNKQENPKFTKQRNQHSKTEEFVFNEVAPVTSSRKKARSESAEEKESILSKVILSNTQIRQNHKNMNLIMNRSSQAQCKKDKNVFDAHNGSFRK